MAAKLRASSEVTPAARLCYRTRMPRLRIASDLQALAARDPDIAVELGRLGVPASRRRPPGFPTLLRIILGQQVSTRAAAAMWTKLETALGGAVTPAAICGSDDDLLRACGFSRQKMVYARGLARDVVEERLDLARVARLRDAAAIAALTRVKGIGAWSAEIYLLFALQRADVFPAGDLALQIAFQRLKRLDQRPDAGGLRVATESWRPHRGAAAHLLWHAYANPPLA
jgi:DNA-3-methyladenine glycosylase II